MYKQLQQRGMESPPVNIGTLREMKQAREPIACLTAYDASFAQLVDLAGMDLVLVGDSLGMVIQGHDTTVPVTVADIIYHTRNVARGLRRAFLVADMPFMSYTDPAQALDNAVRMMQEGGAMMIKLEGGAGQVEKERTLQIRIPAGVDEDSQLRIANEGEPGANGGPSGDLYVVLHVAEHKFFKRDGTHLVCEMPIGVAQAALGATVEVPTLDGGTTKLHIPEGTQSGSVLKIRGQGIPVLGGRGRGDLHVLVRVVVPKHLTAEQRKLFEQLAKTLPVPTIEDKEKTLLDRMKDLLS